VARDVKYHTLHESQRPYIYVPLLQSYSSQGSVLARTVGNPNNLILPFQTAAKELNPQLAFFDVQSMSTFMAYSTFGQRVTAMLLGIFGILALLLAATGLYGVIALGVAQRVHEIGIRMALGAQRFTILLLIVRGALILTFCGVILGVIASFAASRLIANQIYGISASDPLTFLGISLMLGIVAVLASVTPATRAIRIDPLQALRYE
jgi:putative ABC transport system permease protein